MDKKQIEELKACLKQDHWCGVVLSVSQGLKLIAHIERLEKRNQELDKAIYDATTELAEVLLPIQQLERIKEKAEAINWTRVLAWLDVNAIDQDPKIRELQRALQAAKEGK